MLRYHTGGPVSESTRIADQLKRAYSGVAWHGPALLPLLRGVRAAQAAARPIPNAHSIWELVLHTAAWDKAVQASIEGRQLKLTSKQNFPPVPNPPTEAAWREAVTALKNTHAQLVKIAASLPDSRLKDRVPGKKHNVYAMLHGVVQHEIYHAGQIALLKKSRP